MAAVGFKVTKGRFQKGNNFRFGPDWPGQRCGAKTRKGAPCQRPAYKRNGRCSLHGGLSTGPRTAEGKARIASAHFVHGKRSKKFVEARKRLWAELRRVEREMRADGII